MEIQARDDAKILNTKQALWIGSDKAGTKLNHLKKGFVMIVGTLDYDPRQRGYGHLAAYLAELRDIEQIAAYDD